MPYTATTVLPGYTSSDYSGSYEEYVEIVARDMVDRYLKGDQGMIDNLAFGGTGQPAIADFGSTSGGNQGQVSYQTQKWALDYAKNFAANDPYIVQQYGAPPSVGATFTVDPNSPSQLDAANNKAAAEAQAKTIAAQQAMNAADNAAMLQAQQLQNQATLGAAGIHAGATVEAANIGAASQQKIAGMNIASQEKMQGIQIQADWKIAVLQDATDRYIAEGSWGVQKYVAQLQEQGMNTRLQWELGFRREELAQRAVEERNRHHESLLGLALEVAKYDAELGAQPRNWLKYAAWLEGRDIMVNGLTLSMAAQEVPDEAIDPSNVAGTSAIGAYQTGLDMQHAFDTITGASGGSLGPEGADPFGGRTIAGPGAQPYGGGPMTAEEIGQANPGDFLNRLLGSNPMAATSADASAENLQREYDTVDVTGDKSATTGYRTNALGMQVQSQGSQGNYNQFLNLLPSNQQRNLGAAESVGADAEDYLTQMYNAAPKGRASSVSYG